MTLRRATRCTRAPDDGGGHAPTRHQRFGRGWLLAGKRLVVCLGFVTPIPSASAQQASPPGYEMVLTVTPDTSGEQTIICNEYCGIGHHNMVGKIYVTPAGGTEGGS